MKTSGAIILTLALLLFGCASGETGEEPSSGGEEPTEQPVEGTEDPGQESYDPPSSASSSGKAPAADGRIGELGLITMLDKTGRAQIVFVDIDHRKYVKTRSGSGDTTWYDVNRREVVLTQRTVPVKKLCPTLVMDSLLKTLRETTDFFDHARPYDGALLGANPGIAVIAELNGRLYALPTIKSGQLDTAGKRTVVETKKLLIEGTRIPSHQFGRTAPERAFQKQ